MQAMANFLLPNQETQRLLFRKLEDFDFETWLKLFKDEHTAKMLGMDGFKTRKRMFHKMI